MDIDIAVWLAGLVFVLLTWLLMATGWGFVDRVDKEGFVFRSLLRTTRFIRWESLVASVQHSTSVLPRVIVRLSDRRFSSLHTSFAILLRQRESDREFLNAIQNQFKVVPVENIQDLKRW